MTRALLALLWLVLGLPVALTAASSKHGANASDGAARGKAHAPETDLTLPETLPSEDGGTVQDLEEPPAARAELERVYSGLQDGLAAFAARNGIASPTPTEAPASDTPERRGRRGMGGKPTRFYLEHVTRMSGMIRTLGAELLAQGVPVDGLLDGWQDDLQAFWTKVKSIERASDMAGFKGQLMFDGILDDGNTRISVRHHRSSLSGIADAAELHREAQRATAFVERVGKDAAEAPDVSTVVFFRAVHPAIKAHMRELARDRAGRLGFASLSEPEPGKAAEEIQRVVRGRFEDSPELKRMVYGSLYNHSLGTLAELRALEEIRKRGYEILHVGKTFGGAELDVVVRDPKTRLVLIGETKSIDPNLPRNEIVGRVLHKLELWKDRLSAIQSELGKRVDGAIFFCASDSDTVGFLNGKTERFRKKFRRRKVDFVRLSPPTDLVQ